MLDFCWSLFDGSILGVQTCLKHIKPFANEKTSLRASKNNNFDKHQCQSCCWFKPLTGPMQSPNTTTSLAPCGSSWLMSHRHTAWQGTCIVTKDVKFGSLNIPWVKRRRRISVRPHILAKGIFWIGVSWTYSSCYNALTHMLATIARNKNIRGVLHPNSDTNYFSKCKWIDIQLDLWLRCCNSPNL